MANKGVFSSSPQGRMAPPATHVNEAGGKAYKFSSKHALAQFAATGTLNDAFYSTAEQQLEAVLKLCATVELEFVAKTAVYAREKGFMKDMPALLAAFLVANPGGLPLLKKIFPRIMDNGKMLRNFVQILRSGRTGRKSLGTGPKKLIQRWLESRTDEQLFRDSVGNDPSLADVIRLVHPAPSSEQRRALFGYICGIDSEALKAAGQQAKPWGVGYDSTKLPALVREFEEFKKARAAGQKNGLGLPKVPMEMLTGIELSESDWETIAGQASWTQTRMNLNSWNKHGVFRSKAMVKKIADRLRDPELIQKSKVFPYQLLMTYTMTEELPGEIRLALQDAMEVACSAVVVPEGDFVICPDVSGSMSSPATGHRAGATTKVRCIDIAALVAAVFLRKNEKSAVIPFEQGVVRLQLNPRDSIMTNASRLASIGGGGTNCSAPLALLNKDRVTDIRGVVYISDNESWMDSSRTHWGNSPTETMRQWSQLKTRNPNAKMVCIDIQANDSTQAQEQKDILNIGGFSDAVFETISRFFAGASAAGEKEVLTPQGWVDIIEAVSL